MRAYIVQLELKSHQMADKVQSFMSDYVTSKIIT